MIDLSLFVLGYVAVQLSYLIYRMIKHDLRMKQLDEEYEKRSAMPHPIVNVGGQLRVGPQQQQDNK